MKKRCVVLDTSAFLSGKDPISFVEKVFGRDAEILVPHGVVGELRSHMARMSLEVVLGAGGRVVHPTDGGLGLAKKMALETGDLGEGGLTDTDLEVIAVAFDTDGVVVSDDYRIQNVCSHAGIKFVSISERGIKGEWVWVYRCSGCGRRYSSPVDVCPVCGSEVIRKRGAEKKG